jgi:hypothetical protein
MGSEAWASSLPKPASWEFKSTVDQCQAIGIIIFIVAVTTYLVKAKTFNSNNFPIINPSKSLEIFGKARRQEYISKGSSIFNKGVERFPGKPFKVLTESGEITVLPPSWAHEIRNEPNLHFMKAVHTDFHADYAPFKPFASATSDDDLLQAVARKQLTKYLSKSKIALK